MRGTWLSVRFDFGKRLLGDVPAVERVAEILVRPCFASLQRCSEMRGPRWGGGRSLTAAAISEVLLDDRNKGLWLDSGAGDLIASGEIQSGFAALALPAPTELAACVDAIAELADVLETGAGFIAAEPSYPQAHEVALGGRLPRERDGLSDRRRIERRGRDWHAARTADQLAGLEWCTFLGAGHLAQIDLDAVRAAHVFERVVSISPQLALLQLTADPSDDIAIERRIPDARSALAPILMDLSDVTLA